VRIATGVLPLVLYPCLALCQIQVPRVWDDALIADLEVPLAHAKYSPKHMSAEFCYKIPVLTIWKSYPVYHPDREPTGYLEWLRSQEPKEVWNSKELKSDADCVRAGEVVFDAPIAFGSMGIRPQLQMPYLHDKGWYDKVRPPLTKEGMLPFYQYVIRKKGTIDIGILSCAMCHTRVMPDGSVIKGAQGNFPFDRAMLEDFLTGANSPFLAKFKLSLLRMLYFVPWASEEQSSALVAPFNSAVVATSLGGRLPGSLTRHRSTLAYPIQVPDLIGVEDRHYLDRTGLQQSHGLADLMRYAALNQRR
jgi:hypothetical protein